MTYIAIGISYNKRIKKLNGKESIPHIEFWRDFPYLVMDGFVFSVKKLKNLKEIIRVKINKRNSGYNNL
jgi:hypothetical protein